MAQTEAGGSNDDNAVSKNDHVAAQTEAGGSNDDNAVSKNDHGASKQNAMDQNQQTKDSEQIDWKKWTKDMKVILGRFRGKSKPFSISIVPEELRKWNENAYMPKAISIGPRYRGTRKDLLQMDLGKWNCMLSLLHRPQDKAGQNLEKCRKHFLELEKDILASYVGDLKLKEDDLAKIMLCDACFLLELLICKSENLNKKLRSRSNPAGPGPELVQKEHLLTDLLVLENQIPLVILRELSKQLFPKGFKDDGNWDVETLALNLFGYFPECRFNAGKSASNLLELVHSYMSWRTEKTLEENHESQHNGSVVIPIESPEAKLKRCAPILEAAGVKIRDRDEGGTSRSGFNFHIRFSKSGGKLEIPPLHITKETEVRWRNLIAWEQSHTGFGCKHICTCAAFLFNDLICCEKDVQLLKHKQVIVDHSKKSNKQLLEFFRSMVKGVDRGKINDSAYWEMVDDLNKYSARNYCAKQFPVIMWHSWLPKASRKTGNYLLRGYNFMLAAISILTIVQTYYAIVSYYYPKN